MLSCILNRLKKRTGTALTLTDHGKFLKTAIGPIPVGTLIRVVLGVAMVEILLHAISPQGTDFSLWMSAVSRFLEGVLIIMILFFEKPGLRAAGLSKSSAVSGLGRGFLWSAGFGGIALLAFGSLAVMGIDPLRFIKTPLPFNTGGMILFFLVGGVVSPITEELFFRGVLYGFIRRWGVIPAVVFSSLAFVWAHPNAFSRFSWIQLTGGLLFASAYETEKNLMVPITLHMLGNMAIFTLSSIS